MFRKFKTKYRKLEEAYEKLFNAYDHMERAYVNCDRALNGNELQLKYYRMICDLEYQVARTRKEESLLMLQKKLNDLCLKIGDLTRSLVFRKYYNSFIEESKRISLKEDMI